MTTDNPNIFTAKVSDIGLLSVMELKNKQISDASNLNYLAPEQVEGRDVGNLIDVWALGCILFEMVTTEKAFNDLNIAGIV